MTTKGPWRRDGWNYGGDAFFGRDRMEGRLLGETGEVILGGTATEGEDLRVYVSSESNAYLIAAAPDMLEMLMYISDHGCATVTDFDMVRAAIAKAEGR